MKILSQISKLEKWLLVGLFLITVFLRFPGLGCSHFYGDETKVLYWNKTIPANEFLMEQRKGPVQFMAVWFVETLTGGFDEFAVRLPFAIAGTLAVFAFYITIRKLFNWQIAMISTFLFATNGFMIAFSRTAQYQSFLLLFGFLGIYFATFKDKWKLALSGAFLGLAFLSHYDAIFLTVPTLYLLIKNLVGEKNKREIIERILYFVIPLVLLVGAFYVPYILGGYFSENTTGYVHRRIYKLESATSMFQTYSVYNPFILSLVILAFGGGFLFTKYREKAVILDIWFTVPFIVFEAIFLSSGTHIMHYFIPLFVMVGISLFALYELAKKYKFSDVLMVLYSITLIGLVAYSGITFVPSLSRGHPWKHKPNHEYKLFLYGFPYNRGWDQVGDFLRDTGARDFYTNDNVTIGEFYARGVPANKFEPEYYIYMRRSQEFRDMQTHVFGMYNYDKVQDVKVDGDKIGVIFVKGLPAEPVVE